MTLRKHWNSKVSMSVMFFTFLGFYVLLALFIFLGFGSSTRLLTIPIKGLILMLIGFELIHGKILLNTRSFFWSLFMVFLLIYIPRLLYDVFFSMSKGELMRPASDYLLFLISSVLLPMVYFGRVKDDSEIKILFKSLLFSGIGLMLLTILLYRQLIIENVTRSGGAEEGTLGGLVLSYSSIILIGISILGWLNKSIKWKYALLLIVISIPAFSLGASKGSVAALLFSVFFVISAQQRGKMKAFILGFVALSSSGLYLFYTNSGLINRFIYAWNRINSSGGRDGRALLWEQAIINFKNSPFTGDFIEVRHATFLFGKSYYPHNFILEALISTGIIGGIPFILLVGFGLRMSYQIIKQNQINNYWIAMLFVQCLIHNMFSGALYNGIWFWSSLGLVLGRYSYYVYCERHEQTMSLSKG